MIFSFDRLSKTTTNTTSGRRSLSQCRTMALDIVKLYISLISEFFKLSDVAVMGGTYNSNPRLIPKNTHSPCTAYYLLKISADIQETVNELNGLEISQDNVLKGFLESVRWRFEDILVESWLRGMQIPIIHYIRP